MNAGIYIHTPFCRSRCSYCDFATGMYETGAAEKYVQALTKEILSWNVVANPEPIDTIYFGGGTPSLLSVAQLERILKAVRSRFEVAGDTELTIEMNPGDTTGRDEKLTGWQQLGINRVSFGAQTFDDEALRLLGRSHSADDIRATFQQLRDAGFTNVNFDLIAGLSSQTLAGWKHNLSEALALRPEHLSLYLLEVHEGTPLSDQIRRGQRAPVDDDLTADMYRLMIDMVCSAGYDYYEISNFALPGFESRHNTKYWIGAPYYGFGCSAHSYDGAFRRWSNERDSAAYTNLVSSGQPAITTTTELNEHEVRAESLFLNLRLMRGLNTRDFQKRFGTDPRETYREDLQRFYDAGLMEGDGDLIRLTQHGALLSNEVFAAFV
jgi:oxygen-independent coproporphyrinogen-3 oxidase